MTKVIVRRGRIEQAKADAIVVNLFKDVKKPGGAAAAVDAALGGAISDLLRLGDFKGKLKELTLLHTRRKLPAPRVLLVGLGDRRKFKPEHARQVAARVAVAARDKGIKTLATIVHGAGLGGLEPGVAAFCLVEGTLLGLYEYKEYKSKPKKGEEEPEKELHQLDVLETEAPKVRRMEKAAREAEVLASITNDVRTWVNRPSADKTPPVLAQAAVEWGRKHGFKTRVLEKAKVQDLKMGGLLGVAQGSVHEPKFVILEKPGASKRSKTVVLVGKGVTFDSGGISIKPAAGMDAMRHDMAGAAAVLGAVAAAARLRVPHHVVGLLPLAENMPSGSAIRPGDILRAYDGSTVEVLNTDAEGRLLLADALAYAVKNYEPDALIDIATLTGAIKTALGTITTGVMGSDDRLVRDLVAAGKRVGDDLWQLPLHHEYERHVKSEVADVRNQGVNWGGSITAAAFLKHFVGKTRWAHLDIAGTCWTDKGPGDLRQEWLPKGATGVGVRLFTEYLRTLR